MSAPKCFVHGCTYVGTMSFSSNKYLCDFHDELFARGSKFKGAMDRVTKYAAWHAVRELKVKLGKIDCCVLESEARRLIEEVRTCPIRAYLPDPAILDRREIVNGVGQKIPEPVRMYAQRVDVQLVKFIVDKAIFDAGLHVSGKGLQADLPLGDAKEAADG